MPRAKLTTLICVGALTFGAASAATASANWMINGTDLVGSHKTSNLIKTQQSWVFESVELQIVCSGNINLSQSELITPNKISIGAAEFTGCSITTPNCTLSGNTITTRPLSGLAALGPSGLASDLLIKPQTKTLFATFRVLGSLCSAEGLEPMTGGVNLLLPDGHDERLSHEINAETSSASGEFKILMSTASLKGAGLLELEGDPTWSFL